MTRPRSNRACSEQAKSAVLSVLGIGIANAKTSDQIQVEAGVEASRTQEAVRSIVRELILDGHPVGSSPEHGFWIVESQAELALAAGDLEARIRGIAERREALCEAFRKRTEAGPCPAA